MAVAAMGIFSLLFFPIIHKMQFMLTKRGNSRPIATNMDAR